MAIYACHEKEKNKIRKLKKWHIVLALMPAEPIPILY